MQYENKEKPSICFVCPEGYPVLAELEGYPIGGAEVQQVLIAKGLVEWGFDVSFVAGDYGQPEVEIIDGIRVFRSYKVRHGNRKARFLPDSYLVYKAMARANAAIYYQRCVFHQTARVALFAKHLKKKFVFSAGHDQNALPISQLSTLHPVFRLSYKWAIYRADLLLCQNTFQKQNFEKNYGLRAEIIPNLVEEKSKQETRETAKRPLILWVGTFNKRKQPLLFAEIARKMPDADFLMIGDSQDDVLFKRVQEIGRKCSNLTILGPLPRKSISDYYMHSFIFVSTSFSEGFPNTFLEAMASGLPIVSFSVNPDDVLSQSSAGVACEGKASEIVKNLKWLISDTSAYHKMSDSGISYIKKYHSPNTILPLYAEIIKKMIKKEN